MGRKELTSMALNETIKKSWIELQKKYDYPVNAIGLKIADRDAQTLRVWRDEGIDRFVKK
jgi:hypothetical protein